VYLGYDVIDNAVTSRVVGYLGDGHMLTIGPTRSGKSRRLLIPNLLMETARSALVVDIKGELAAITAPQRSAKGSNVLALDPFGVLAKRRANIPTVGFNPLATLDPQSDDFVDDAMTVAEALIQVTPGMKEPHWAEAAQDFACGVIMLARCKFGPAANLGQVRGTMARSPEDMEKLAREFTGENCPHYAIANKLGKFRNSKDSKEIASILSTASTQTRFLDSPGIARNLAAGGVDFGAMKSKPTTIYLVLPPNRLLSHAKWLRLVISSAMTAMQRTLKAEGSPDVLFMLDEFPQLGRLQSIESAVSLNAGYGVKVWVAVQHLGQLKEDYGDNWETFLSAGAVTAFAPRDWFTRDHLTKIIGTGTKKIRSISNNAGQTSFTDSVQKDDLVSAQDWRGMVMGEQYAFIPTKDAQLIKRIMSVDFTELPGVKSGSIILGR
jgi:type IV secretion system protein VirD4